MFYQLEDFCLLGIMIIWGRRLLACTSNRIAYHPRKDRYGERDDDTMQHPLGDKKK